MEALSPAFALLSASGTSSKVGAQSTFRSCLLSGIRSRGSHCPYYLQSAYRIRARDICPWACVGSPDKKTENSQEEEKTTALAPNALEVQSLLMEVCDETSIAELQLTVGAFKLHMKRDVGKIKGAHSSVTPVVPPVSSKQMVESATAISSATPPASKAPLMSTVSLLASPVSKRGTRFGLFEAAADEGLLFVTSPKVGLFRRSRVVKKKNGRPLCEEGQTIKVGQVVCYVEQLGTQEPVESEVSGEVVKILCQDGEAVGYGDPLFAVRPSFAGIK